ncbi:MAG: tetratricopeptide repeat protein [Planctomycetota bacterium]|nr:MAG: tetratricopeptide repeat protein [Planctomycetota bacterium]
MSRVRTSPDAEPAPDRRAFVLGPGLPFVVALIWGAASLGNQFTYDDRPVVLDNPRIRSLSNLNTIWLTDYWEQTSSSDPVLDPRRDRLYRPLTLTTFALNFTLSGANPFGYHLTNVVLHALVCAMLFYLARRLLASAAAATAAALLFAVHPVHSEAVAGLVGRAELLAALGLIGGLLLLLADRPPRPLRALAAAGCFLAALFSKESAVCYPLVTIVMLAWVGRLRAWRDSWLLLGATLAAPLLIYLPVRYAALDGQLIRAGAVNVILNPLFEAHGVERIWGALAVLGHYARVLTVPIHLCADYGLAVIDPRAGVTPMVLVGAAAAAGLVVALTGVASHRPLRRTLGLCAALFVASYLLISNTFLLIGVAAAERLMYWPSVAVCLACGALFAALRERRAAAGSVSGDLWRVLGVGVLVVFGVRGVLRNLEWHDNATLFNVDRQTCPASAHIQVAAGSTEVYLAVDALRRRSQAEFETHLRAAEEALDAALSITTRIPRALRERGHAYWLAGDLDSAARYLMAALALDPTDHLTRSYLARLERQSVPTQQLDALQQAVTTRPSDAEPRVELAAALLHAGRVREALVAAEEAARLAPQDATAVRTYGEALLANLRFDEATDVLRRAADLAPDDWRIHANLARLLSHSDPQSALRHARRAYELAPGDFQVRTNYGEALALVGRKEEALRVFRELVDTLPPGDPLRTAVAERIADLSRP